MFSPTGTYDLPVGPPKITQHPGNNLNVVRGSRVKFTVAATTDAGNLTYRWRHNGINIDPPPVGVSGTDTSTLTIDDVHERHTGEYTCVVNNGAGNITSNAAQLTLRECL